MVDLILTEIQQNLVCKLVHNAINYYQNNTYRSLEQQIEACIDGKIPNCDETQLYMEQQRGFAKFSADVLTVGVAVNNTASGVAINSVNVDTSVFDNSLIGRIVNFGQFVAKLQSSLQDAVDPLTSPHRILPVTELIISGANESLTLAC